MTPIPIWEAALANTALKLGITDNAKKLLATNGAASVLETAIKQIPNEEIVKLLKKRSMSVSKKLLGVIPTTEIRLKFD